MGADSRCRRERGWLVQARSSLVGSRGAPGLGGQDLARKGKLGDLTLTPRRVDYMLNMPVQRSGVHYAQVRATEFARGVRAVD